MSYAEALHYDMIFWIRFNEERRRTSFSEISNLLLVRPERGEP